MEHENLPLTHRLEYHQTERCLTWACCGQPDDQEVRCPRCQCYECGVSTVDLFANNLCADCTCKREGHDWQEASEACPWLLWCYRCNYTTKTKQDKQDNGV